MRRFKLLRALNMTLMYYIYGDMMPVKTTILLKDEIYEELVKKYGRRKISKTINEVLTKQFSTTKKSMFGADPWLTVTGLRDEKEPHESA
jgi:hypothetical protein